MPTEFEAALFQAAWKSDAFNTLMEQAVSDTAILAPFVRAALLHSAGNSERAARALGLKTENELSDLAQFAEIVSRTRSD